MNRVDRLFAIVTFIQGKKHVTVQRLSEHFGISERTVFRDLKALQESGIPIGFENNKGYFLVEGYFTPPIAFTHQEANALLLSQQLIHGFTDKTVKANLDSAITKIRSVLKKSDSDKVNNLDERMRFQLPERLTNEQDYMATIQEAICRSKQLNITYTNTKQESSTRIVEPIGLVFYAFSWHMIAYCWLKREYRDFKLNRINALRLMDTDFTITTHIPLSDYKLPVNY